MKLLIKNSFKNIKSKLNIIVYKFYSPKKETRIKDDKHAIINPKNNERYFSLLNKGGFWLS